MRYQEVDCFTIEFSVMRREAHGIQLRHPDGTAYREYPEESVLMAKTIHNGIHESITPDTESVIMAILEWARKYDCARMMADELSAL